MALCRFNAQPLLEPILAYCQLDPKEQPSLKFKSKCNNFHLRKCISNVSKMFSGLFRTQCSGFVTISLSPSVVQKSCQRFRVPVFPLTCIGISPSEGNRTQFLHIFMTMSSRNTTISLVQYCIRHGLVVKVAVGIFFANSPMMVSGMGGLMKTYINPFPDLPTFENQNA